MIRLSAASLDSLPIDGPTYDRSKVRTGIVHFGVGGFHRAHQAMYVDKLMNSGVGLEWGITGVGTMPFDEKMRDVLKAQDGLYTLVLKHSNGGLAPRVIGSIIDYLYAPDDPSAVLDRLTDPAVRIVSLTITEGGYHVNQVTGDFDPSDPGIQHDLSSELPLSAFGLVVKGLARRRAAGVPAYTVMSCDNIPGNGDVARKMLTSYARLKDPELARFIENEVRFPNCMVDRITPVTADADKSALAELFGVEDGWPVVCEPFTQWVLEDAFGGERPPFEDVGVQLVSDVEPYELMKLRLLNASHQSLCYLGYLAGYRYAHEVCSDPLFVKFLLGYMDEEGTPTLPEVPGVDLTAYKNELISRFANPEVRDTLARLCAESSDRIPKWLLPVVREQLAAGREIKRSALVVAAWARYAEGTDESGEPIEVVDRLRDVVMERAASPDPLVFISDPDLFGTLASDQRFVSAYTAALESLHSSGARATVEATVGA